MSFSSKLLVVSLCLIGLVNQSYALPPLGLTQISSMPVSFPPFGFVPAQTIANLELISDSGYLGVENVIWTIDTSGNKSFVTLSHPTLGSPSSVTRVVKAFDGDLYVAANFGTFNNPTGAALYRLNEPTAPLVTWEFARAGGVDANLRTFGDTDEAVRLLLNDSIESLPYPSPSIGSFTELYSATPTGNAVGTAGIPGTAGAAPAFWTPDGQISFVFGFGFAFSIRDRINGEGVNIGANLTAPTVRFGPAGYEIQGDDGAYLDISDNEVIVSHSDFAIFETTFSFQSADYFAFYPGIVPGHVSRSRPLLDIFPELAAIDIDIITDLASVNGHLYMTLSGSDGLYLFGARDPSVVPEPTALLLATLAGACLFLGRWLYARKNRSGLVS